MSPRRTKKAPEELALDAPAVDEPSVDEPVVEEPVVEEPEWPAHVFDPPSRPVSPAPAPVPIQAPMPPIPAPIISPGIQQRADNITRGLLLLIAAVLAFMALLAISGRCDGPQGVIGPVGLQGVVGDAGPPGNTETIVGPPGPAGDAGVVGTAGPRGETGAVGAPGPAGELGSLGETGPAGPAGESTPGEIGPIGPSGEQGPVGPSGEITYINAAPGAANTVVPYTLLFHADGIEVANAGSVGSEVPRRLSRRVLDLSQAQAVRIQWAHNLSEKLIQLRVEYWHEEESRWIFLTPQIGEPVAAFENQASGWVATPRFLTNIHAVKVRALVVGDGEMDPRVTYITLDTK